MFKKLCILEKLIPIVILLILTSCATTQKQPIVKIEPIEKFEITNSLDNSLSDLVTQITNSITEDGKKKIAVIEFSDLEGNVTQFGKFLAEELITRLFRTKKFEVVERQLLNKIISEQKLSITGMIDPNSAKELGRILGVDAIVSGTITDFVTDLKVNARIISTETGKVFGVAATNIVKDDNVRKLMGIISTVKKEEVQEQTEKKEISLKATKNIPINEVLYSTGNWRIELVSYRIFSDRSIKFILTVENLQENPEEFRINSGKGTYLLDNLTNNYHESIISPKEIVQIIQKNPVNYSITFNNLKEGIRNVVFYLEFLGSHLGNIRGMLPREVNSSPIKITDSIVQKEEVEEQTEKKEISKEVLKKVEVENFTFELTKCEMSSGGRVTCDLLITNNDKKDRELSPNLQSRGAIRVIDDSGNEYSVERIQLGNRTGKGGIIRNLLVSGVPMRAIITFDNVSQEARSIALLEINCAVCLDRAEWKWKEFSVQLRNITLSKGD